MMGLIRDTPACRRAGRSPRRSNFWRIGRRSREVYGGDDDSPEILRASRDFEISAMRPFLSVRYDLGQTKKENLCVLCVSAVSADIFS